MILTFFISALSSVECNISTSIIPGYPTTEQQAVPARSGTDKSNECCLWPFPLLTGECDKLCGSGNCQERRYLFPSARLNLAIFWFPDIQVLDLGIIFLTTSLIPKIGLALTNAENGKLLKVTLSQRS